MNMHSSSRPRVTPVPSAVYAPVIEACITAVAHEPPLFPSTFYRARAEDCGLCRLGVLVRGGAGELWGWGWVVVRGWSSKRV